MSQHHDVIDARLRIALDLDDRGITVVGRRPLAERIDADGGDS